MHDRNYLWWCNNRACWFLPNLLLLMTCDALFYYFSPWFLFSMPSTLLSVITHLHLETAKWTHLFIICLSSLISTIYGQFMILWSLLFTLVLPLPSLIRQVAAGWPIQQQSAKWDLWFWWSEGGRGKHQICGYGKKQQSSCKWRKEIVTTTWRYEWSSSITKFYQFLHPLPPLTLCCSIHTHCISHGIHK